MFVACGIWCLADVSSVSPSSEQTYGPKYICWTIAHTKVHGRDKNFPGKFGNYFFRLAKFI